MSFVDALRNGQIQYTGKQAENVNINLGNGNAQISVRGDKVNITTGVGNQTVGVLGNDVNIKLDQNATADWDFTQDFDTVGVVSDDPKSKVSIDTGNGNDTAVAIADNVNIKMGEGNHVVSYWGDNVDITVGDTGSNGYNVIMSADKALTEKNLYGNSIMSENTTIAGINIGQAAVDAIDKNTRVITNTWKEYQGADKTSFLNAMKTTYKLDDVNMTALEKLYDSGDLFKTFKGSDGKEYPRYSIMNSVKQKGSDGSVKNIICYNDSVDGKGYVHTRGLIANGTNFQANLVTIGGTKYGFGECVATKQASFDSYTMQQTVTTYTEQYNIISGTQNLNIKVGDSAATIIDVTASKDVSIDGKDATGQGYAINVDAEVQTEKYITNDGGKKEDAKTVKWGFNVGSTYTSPLVIDMDRDGKVEAASGNGIDANGDGIEDGYATGGDKMLAMSDINGNGKVDGAEVFGNNTVSPFSGKALNAANGFEALKMLAQEAEQYTGAKCYSNGKVDLAALKAALATVGVNLGYISDENTTAIEDLEKYDIASITVDEYETADDQSNDVQHRQLGSATTTDGTTVKTDDVWFRDRHAVNKMLDSLK